MPIAVPPSKAISIRVRSLTTADQLYEHSLHAVRMDERDLHPVQAAVRLPVDQLAARRLHDIERGREVVGLEGDVVHSGAPLGQELADGSVLAQRRQQFDA